MFHDSSGWHAADMETDEPWPVDPESSDIAPCDPDNYIWRRTKADPISQEDTSEKLSQCARMLHRWMPYDDFNDQCAVRRFNKFEECYFDARATAARIVKTGPQAVKTYLKSQQVDDDEHIDSLVDADHAEDPAALVDLVANIVAKECRRKAQTAFQKARQSHTRADVNKALGCKSASSTITEDGSEHAAEDEYPGPRPVHTAELHIFKRDECPHCSQLEKFLQTNQIPYSPVRITDANRDSVRKYFAEKWKHRTVPAVTIVHPGLHQGGNSSIEFLGGRSDVEKIPVTALKERLRVAKG